MHDILGIENFILQNGFSKNEMCLKDAWDVSIMKCEECGSSNVKVSRDETVCMSCYTVLSEGMYSGQMLI